MNTPKDSINLASIRHHLHAHPEIGLKEFKTAKFISNMLNSWGLEVTSNIGGTGIVASLRRGQKDHAIGLRADMDGLPMFESGQHEYKSRHEGCMHACGHDGHMAMLLGAAHAMANDPDFNGNVHFIFQPAEENFGGAKLMIEDGLFNRFPCDHLFALHNMPGIPVGKFASRDGAIMASIDVAGIEVLGKGGHGAQPEKTIDPIVIGSQIVTAFQTVVSRNINQFEPGVVTVGSFHSGSASNIIPDRANLEISLRATDPDTRILMIKKLEELASSIARGFGGSAEFDWQTGYPVAVNNSKVLKIAREAIINAFGPGSIELTKNPWMGSEDFSFMLEKVPGAFLFIGNGDSAPVHNSEYDFDDRVIPFGVKFYQSLANIIFNR
ncbi:MAG: amidohydrolase [Desulfobacteraceae bacterium]|nr:amidohydrolase [Desulfobacteraceae bacterium]